MAENIRNETLHIVAIGASAGGMEAFIEMLHSLPEKLGFSYVYLQHLSPVHESNLTSIVGRETKMTVIEAEDKIKIKPDHIYIIPPNTEMKLIDGHLSVFARPPVPYSNMPINMFFSSLAETYKEHAIGIILSGTGSDGSIGLKAIKAEGGITFAQNSSAQFESMPKSAIAEGSVDLVLSPSEITEELKKIAEQKHIYFNYLSDIEAGNFNTEEENFTGILQLLYRSLGIDFNQYKITTIRRRIIRRMILNKLETVGDYLEFIKRTTAEVNLLFQDLLINVTTFFRDPESNDVLKSEVFPKILKNKPANDPIRIWVPACSSGQEAYSLAMLLIEHCTEQHSNLPIQIFATDLSETAINKARLGVYSKDELVNVSSKRLQKFFVKIDGSYRIIKSIRDLCVFATHNIAKDPPFSRLDLISCCNLLIYLDNVLQKKVMATFHYSLSGNGFLVLGRSETVGNSSYLFSPLDKKTKIYTKKKDAAAKAMFEMSYRHYDIDRKLTFETKHQPTKVKTTEDNIDKLVDAILLKRFSPACVVVNYDLDIIQFKGPIGAFLEPSPGKASLNLLKMARSGMALELRNIVHKAKKSGEIVVKDSLEIATGEKPHELILSAIPLKNIDEDEYFLVTFEKKPIPAEAAIKFNKAQRVVELEKELHALREDMRSIVESQEAANEELQSANEEIVSSNEELQSINEELETSKEEIESSNEELLTINQELQIRNEQLADSQEYADAVFGSIRDAVMILDNQLRIKTANYSFYRTFNLKEEETEGTFLYELANRKWDIQQLRSYIIDIQESNKEFNNVVIAENFQEQGKTLRLIRGRRIMHLRNEILLMLSLD